MKTILENTQKLLCDISGLKYVDENWGQLDDYSPHPPTQFPLVLIDVGTVAYSDIGIDRKSSPQNRQLATATVVLSIANLKTTNTSARAPKTQKETAWSIWDIVENVHKTLHGKSAADNAGGFIRTAIRKVRRDDGIQLFEVTYSLGLSNV